MREPARPAGPARCDPSVPSARSPVPHDYVTEGTERGSPEDGRPYGRLRCRACHRVAYEMLPD